MKKLIRKLMVLVMVGAMTAGAFGQGRGGDKRPPKDRGTVISPKPKPSPPPQNSNRPRPDDKKKP